MASPEKKNQENGQADGLLEPMCPQYSEQHHDVYLSLLEEALEDDECHNIALAGPYGSGKSSILEELGRKDNRYVINVSLYTLPLSRGALKRQGDGSQGVLDDSADREGSTDRLEREIVRQLLYQGKSGKMPQSRFNQIHPMGTGKRIACSLFLAIAVLLLVCFVFFCADPRPDKIEIFLSGFGAAAPLVAPVGAALLFAMLLVVSYVLTPRLKGKFRLNKISAEGVAVELDGGSHSCFDQYLDEIIYFFERDERDIVVFEDLDRFEDLSIFNALRELNLLVNNAPDVKGKHSKGVRFVYAVRDSLFDDGGIGAPASPKGGLASSAEAVGSTRSKFFDLIIPVTPFVSDLNAIEQAEDVFADDLKKYPSLDGVLRVVAHYLLDMRLLKSVRNEFRVMMRVHGLDSPAVFARNSLGLTPEGVLAAAAYKCVYPADFERVGLKGGYFDALYELRDKAVQHCVEALREERDFLARTDGVGDTIEERAQTFGASLIEALRGLGLSGSNITVNGHNHDLSYLSDVELWESICSLDEVATLRFSGNGLSPLNIKKAFFRRVCGTGLSSAELDPDKVGVLGRARIKDIDNEVRLLVAADFADERVLSLSLRKSDFEAVKCAHLACSQKLEEAIENGKVTFKNAVEELSPGQLAVDLVVRGFLCRDFALYASVFPQCGMPKVVDFEMHYYREGNRNVLYELSSDECDELLKRVGNEAVMEPRCFNASLLSHLLGVNRGLARAMMRSAIDALKDGGAELLAEYVRRMDLSGGVDGRSEGEVFVSELVGLWARAFDFLLGGQRLSGQQRLLAADVAVRSMGNLNYSFDECGKWLHDNVLSLPAMKNEGLSGKCVRAVASCLLPRCGVEVPDLTKLGRMLAEAVAGQGLFAVNRENLILAIQDGSKEVAPLDRLRSENLAAYARVVSDGTSLRRYLMCLQDDETSLMTDDFYAKQDVMALCAEEEPDDSDSLLALFFGRSAAASATCDLAAFLGSFEVKNIIAVVSGLEAMASSSRIEATLSNAFAFVDMVPQDPETGCRRGLRRLLDGLINCDKGGWSMPEVDFHLLLCAAVEDSEIDDATIRKILSMASQNAESPVPLSASDAWVPYERPALLVELYEGDIVVDGMAVYHFLPAREWDLVERCLAKASRVEENFELDRLRGADIAKIISSGALASTTLGEGVRNDAARWLRETEADPAECADAALALLSAGLLVGADLIGLLSSLDLPGEKLVALAEGGLDAKDAKALLLGVSFESVSAETFSRVMKSLGGRYAKAVDPTAAYGLLDYSEDNEHLADKAKELLGFVSKVTVDEMHGTVRVQHCGYRQARKRGEERSGR